MLPSFSMENVADSRHADPVTTSYGGHRFAGFYSVDDDRDIGLGELGVGVRASACRFFAISRYAVLGIVRVSAQDQMAWVDANFVIACVPDDESHRDIACVDLIGKTMRPDPLSSNF